MPYQYLYDDLCRNEYREPQMKAIVHHLKDEFLFPSRKEADSPFVNAVRLVIDMPTARLPLMRPLGMTAQERIKWN